MSRVACISMVVLLICVSTTHGQQVPVNREAGPSKDKRNQALRDIAAQDVANFQFIAAKLLTGRDTALAWRQLDSLLTSPTGDMFWTYPATAFYFYCRDLIGDEVRARFRNVWKSWTPYRGDTENHFLMYYETLYLMAQEWPGLPGSEWFNGKSSKENFEEAEEYLFHWMDQTIRFGQTEWDSPRYFYFYVVPLLTLYDHADDPAMAHNARVMLELLLADYAVEYLNRSYCGAHSRDGDNSVIEPRAAEATSYSDFYWEDSLRSILPDLAFAAMSDFRCPEIIRSIALVRDTPYVHHERKRSRAKMRYSHRRHSPVYKTTLMTPTYSLGSIQGGLQQPIQQHSWDITFADGRDNNTLFSLHPFADAYELGMFFPEDPEQMESGILQSKATYGSAEKWIGGSPFERIVQDSNELWVEYEWPAETGRKPNASSELRSDESDDPSAIGSSAVRFRHVDFYIPKEVDMIVRDSDDWILVIRGAVVVAIDIERANSSDWIETNGQNAYRLRLLGDTIHCHVVVGGRELMNPAKLSSLRGTSTAHYLKTKREGRNSLEWTFIGSYLRARYGENRVELLDPHGGAPYTLQLRSN